MLASSHRRTFAATALLALCAALLFFPNLLNARATFHNEASLSTLYGSAPLWTRGANVVGPHDQATSLTVGMMLKATHQDELQTLVSSLYDPTSDSYHAWLKPSEFNAQFGPSSSDIAAATNFLTQSGLQVTSQNAGPMMLFATGSTAQVAAAFHTQINDYTLTNGAIYYANATNVQLPSYLSSNVLGVYGLNSFKAYKSYDMMETGDQTNGTNATPPPAYGGGPFGSGLTPSQIASIYNVTPVYTQLKEKGHGTTLAVFELSGYTASDIPAYTEQYNLPDARLVDKKVLGGATDNSGAGEVELDIELQIALAPHANKFLVYQSPNTELGSLAQYQQIANDNKADAISSSWGVPCEYGVTSQLTLSENQIFLQMATQGQSMFSASGDAGAYGCARAGIALSAAQGLQIGDPNNQPYNTAVGGTSFKKLDKTITFDPGSDPNPAYPGADKELTWIRANCTATACDGGGSGGGVSRIWGSPDYIYDSTGNPLPGVIETKATGYDKDYSQSGAYCNQQPGVQCRQNPDVSLDADPSTGYSIYCTDPADSFCKTGEFGQPGWIRLGGTSCAAPLWAAIAALDIEHHGKRLGLFNYILYPFDSTAGYASQFHDITQQDNGYYPAKPGYDMATGIGTPDVYNLITA
ncbi:MAG: protease pro-enzyme activation domain-containing protein [Ktedonobacteraceae bacterium]